MNPRAKKFLLLVLALALFATSGLVQNALNHDRDRLGLTRLPVLENAPPVLAFTTVALGGFRGLISNALWIRASDLQDEDKFFEAMQLADWITKLEPHFSQVWVHQAWNMAYNISVKFKETPNQNPDLPKQYPDRWRWVRAGIELLRDEGLRYNPDDVLIHQQLAWLFQHKMGANLDDANMYYKQMWANEMATVFGKLRKPNLEELLNPQTDDERARAKLLREKFKMDVAMMKRVDQEYGPLEWRLPESHAIYWAAMGLEKARLNPDKVKQSDLIQLRRVIYQDMQLAVLRGRLVANPYTETFDFGPNIDIIPKANQAYEQAMEEDAENRDHIAKAHRNLLRYAVYFLYGHARLKDAAEWYKYLGTKYPDKILLDGKPDSYPRNLTLEEYCLARAQEDIDETSRDQIKSRIEEFLIQMFQNMILGEDESAAGLRMKAVLVRNAYLKKVDMRVDAIPIPPIEETERELLNRLLDPEQTFIPYEARAVLRTKLRMPPEPAPDRNKSTTPSPAASGTNAPAATNSPSR